MMVIGDLLEGSGILHADNLNLKVKDISYFANHIEPDWCYVACDLPWKDGYGELQQAIARGASVIVADKVIDARSASGRNVILVRDSKIAYSTMCANMFNHAYKKLSIYGVTGTKGKTTTCHLLESIYRCAGLKVGLISSVKRKLGDQETPSDCTTPDPKALHMLLHNMYNAGASHIILEVSSIGIVEERLYGLQFDGVLFTNLGQDHLVYHGGIDNYKMAKSRLFTEYVAQKGRQSVCVINADDPVGRYFTEISKGKVVTYGNNGDINYALLNLHKQGIDGNACGVKVQSGLLGVHNAYNILGAIALSRHIGLSAKSISKGISQLQSVPGRLQRIGHNVKYNIFVDYAHTPESVSIVLSSLRKLYNGRKLVVVIGCGGGTDKSKRPVMGKISIENSNVCICTSDNPRQEDPMDIIADMLADVDSNELLKEGRLEIEIDRRAAIYRGIELAKSGATLVILGKGHEKFQVIGDHAMLFDDREVAAEALGVNSCLKKSWLHRVLRR